MSPLTTDCGLAKLKGPDLNDIAVINDRISLLSASLSSLAGGSTGASGVSLKDVGGLAGDGSTDDTIALQAAINSLRAGGNAKGTTGTVAYLPPGEYVISSPITIDRFNGTIFGTGGTGNSPARKEQPGHGVVIRWAGPPGLPMFRVTDCLDLHISNLRFEGNNATPPSYGIEFIGATGYDNNGYNDRPVITDCFFGRYSKSSQGADKGSMAAGIGFTGTNGNNDQYRIQRCNFRYCTAYGIYIQNTQTVWGSIDDCTIIGSSTGIYTNSSGYIKNLGIYLCGIDLHVAGGSTSVSMFMSEATSQWLKLGPSARVTVRDGVIQCQKVETSAGKTLIDAYPAEMQTLSISDIIFTGMKTPGSNAIRIGPQTNVAVGAFFVKVERCRGIVPEQIVMPGTMWAASPQSKGVVEFSAFADISTGALHQFRNELRGGALAAGQRATLDRTVWDQPSPG